MAKPLYDAKLAPLSASATHEQKEWLVAKAGPGVSISHVLREIIAEAMDRERREREEGEE